MRKGYLALVIMMVLLLLCHGASAQGVTVSTVSIFAGLDAAADTYVTLLRQWEEKTGNTVIDSSSASDEAWKIGVLNDFGAGNEADILFYFTCTSESKAILNKVVPIAQINEAYPHLNLPEYENCTEADGKVYAIPVRPFWEGLFCNTDLFEEYGLPLPTTWEHLVNAINVFKENGIVPIALSLSDVPHYIAEILILAAGTPQMHLMRPKQGEEAPKSWEEGMALLHTLYKLGAFSEDVNLTSDSAVSQQFRLKQAAMKVDGSWFANSIFPESMDTTVVMPFPTYTSDADKGAFIGGYSMGFYMSKKAWNDAAKRDAAVDLLSFLTTGENAALLSDYSFSGALLESANAMTNAQNARQNPPFQDAMNAQARSTWFNLLPAVMEGTLSARTLWQEVLAQAPFE